MITRTPPPPPGASARALLLWALAEAAAWPPGGPECYYTFWLRVVERERAARRVVQRTLFEEPAP